MEFQEAMKQWARMCHSFRRFPIGCSGCPLVDERCYHEMPYSMDANVIESKVIAWAAEHPEPVYPTWVDWFRQIGVVEPTQKYFHDWLLKPIPADIAKKLGIEPKEGI